MLPVRIDDQNEHPGRQPDAGLHSGAVAFVVRVSDDLATGCSRPLRGVVLRSIVHDENLAPVRDGTQLAHERANSDTFVEGRDND